MSKRSTLLTDDDLFLLKRVRELMEEVIETFDILEDEEAMRSIREAIEDSREGRVRDYEEFIAEMKETGEIQHQGHKEL
jgi:hypothetical protein